MSFDTCSVCGGDGRVSNAFGGSDAKCPACHGNGRRTDEALMRDVTKTKPSHHKSATKGNEPKQTGPTTGQGVSLSNEVQNSAVADTVKARLLREIVEYETTHGRCTKTFTTKVRKQIR